MKLAGDFVAGNSGAAVRLYRCQVRLVGGAARHRDQRDARTPLFVGHTDGHAVEYGRVGLGGGFHFLGKDFLAAGIYRHGTAAEKSDIAIGLVPGEVAWHGIANTVGQGDKCRRRFFRVFVILQRNVTTACHLADFFIAWLEQGHGFFVDNHGAGAGIESRPATGHFGFSGLDKGHTIAADLGSTDAVQQDQFGEVFKILILDGRRKNRPRTDEQEQRGGVDLVLVGDVGFDHRPPHGIADDKNGIDLFFLYQTPDLVRLKLSHEYALVALESAGNAR